MSEGLHYFYLIYGVFMIAAGVVRFVQSKWTMQTSMLAALAGTFAIIAGAERSLSIGLMAILLAAGWGLTQLPRSFGRRK
jgi:uncharacterized membrane protein